MLLEKIVKTTNKKEMILEKLRESTVPLVMYPRFPPTHNEVGGSTPRS